MTKLTIRLMGSFQASIDARPITRFESDKVRALLAYLAVEANQTHRREKLAGILWSNMPEKRARRNLSQALYNLRNLFNDHQSHPPFLHLARDTVQFNSSSDFWLDVAAFTRHIQGLNNQDYHMSGSIDSLAAILQEAVELYRGDFLEGFSLDNDWAFDEWCLILRERLRRQVQTALFNLVEIFEEQGEFAKALPHAWRQVELNPIGESGNRQLMRLLAANHQRNEALTVFEHLQSLLVEELSITPEHETLELYISIKNTSHSKTSTQFTKNNLPEFITPFIGRYSELSELGELLIDSNCRLLTILGPGGSGKSRLALEIAKLKQSTFQHGVFLIPSNPILSPETIPHSIIKAMNLPTQVKGDVKDQIINYLREKNILLIMDGFEHLLDGKEILTEILRSAPRIKLLVTSRVRLNIKGETLFNLMGLNCPNTLTHDHSVQQCDAIQLFLSGAQRVNPDFEPRIEDLEPIIQICRFVQGMPLGILLASSWVSMMTPEEILSEIKQDLDFLSTEWIDVPSRQRSVRTTFDHSWNLLREREKIVFKNLSVFRGGFTRPAARSVSAATPHELRSLIEKSLLNSIQPGRYEIHELLRQYGAEKLKESRETENAAHKRHSIYYCESLADWCEKLRSHHQDIVLDEMSREHENFLAAWNWACMHGDEDLIDSALDGLCQYYDLRICYQEARSALRLASENLPGNPTTRVALRARIRTRAWQSHFERLLGLQNSAMRQLAESQSLVEKAHDLGYDMHSEKAFVLLQRGYAVVHNDDQAAAHDFQQCHQLYQEMNDHWGIALAIEGLGLVVHNTGHFQDAVDFYAKSLELHRLIGDPRGIANSLIAVGNNCLRQGQISKGEKYIQEGIVYLQQIRDLSGIAREYLELGKSYYWSGEFDKSFDLVEKSRPIFEELGIQDQFAFATIAPSLSLSHMGRYREAYSRALQGLTLAQVLDSQRDAAMAHYFLGTASLGMRDFQQAKSWALKSVRTYREIKQKDQVAWGLAVLVFAERALDQPNQAWIYLYEALKIGIEIHSVYPILCSLVGFALLKADEGCCAEAFEITSLARTYPLVSKSVWFENIALGEIDALTKSMPTDTVNAAREKGLGNDVWEIAKELLESDPSTKSVC